MMSIPASGRSGGGIFLEDVPLRFVICFLVLCFRYSLCYLGFYRVVVGDSQFQHTATTCQGNRKTQNILNFPGPGHCGHADGDDMMNRREKYMNILSTAATEAALNVADKTSMRHARGRRK